MHEVPLQDFPYEAIGFIFCGAFSTGNITP